MTNKEFNFVLESTLIEIKEILGIKADEYVLNNADRLKAFKPDWYNENNPKKILWGMLSKHLISIHDMCEKEYGEFDLNSFEKWNEKIIDAINYLILLRALIYECRR